MNMNSGWALHHIGIAVAEIAPATEAYTRMFGYVVESPVIHDPVQTAYVQFLRLPGGQSYLEFVAPDSPQSKLAAEAKRGSALNHMCYGVGDIYAAVAHLRDAGLVLTLRAGCRRRVSGTQDRLVDGAGSCSCGITGARRTRSDLTAHLPIHPVV